MLFGIDRLLAEVALRAPLHGKRIALLAHPASVTRDLTQPPQPTNAEFRERMSGNICRCGAYSNIQDAIAEVAGVTR